MKTADYWLEKLRMRPTGIGGSIALTFHSNESLRNESLPERFDGNRRLYSTNYFLMQEGEILTLHSLHQDELWFFHMGSAVRIHCFSMTGDYRVLTLGSNFDKGELLQAVAPHHHWFGAELVGAGYALMSCSLAPGFDSRDSSLPTLGQLAELKRLFPRQVEVIDLLADGPTRAHTARE